MFFKRILTRFWPEFKKMGNDELIARARQECDAHQWPWFEPIGIQDGYSEWTVVTNYNGYGCNARIVISKRSGKVIRKSFMSR